MKQIRYHRVVKTVINTTLLKPDLGRIAWGVLSPEGGVF